MPPEWHFDELVSHEGTLRLNLNFFFVPKYKSVLDSFNSIIKVYPNESQSSVIFGLLLWVGNRCWYKIKVY